MTNIFFWKIIKTETENYAITGACGLLGSLYFLFTWLNLADPDKQSTFIISNQKIVVMGFFIIVCCLFVGWLLVFSPFFGVGGSVGAMGIN